MNGFSNGEIYSKFSNTQSAELMKYVGIHFIGLEVAQGVHIHFDAAAYEIYYI